MVHTVNGTQYSGKIVTNGSTSYVVGQTMEIQYDKTNPSSISTRSIRYIYYAFGLIALGILCTCSGSVNFYMAQKSKLYAAGTGAGTIFGLFSGRR